MATVTVSHNYTSPAELVFDAWIEPAQAAQWLFHTPDGEMIRCDIDPLPGGTFNLTERRADGDAAHIGAYVEIDRPRRLVFDFKVEPYSKGEYTRVSIDIADAGTGSKLTLTHTGVWDDWAERTRQGWEFLLRQLAKVLGE